MCVCICCAGAALVGPCPTLLRGPVCESRIRQRPLLQVPRGHPIDRNAQLALLLELTEQLFEEVTHSSSTIDTPPQPANPRSRPASILEGPNNNNNNPPGRQCPACSVPNGVRCLPNQPRPATMQVSHATRADAMRRLARSAEEELALTAEVGKKVEAARRRSRSAYTCW